MRKNIIIIIGALVAFFLIIGVWLGVKLAGVSPNSPSSYSAVYLSTGDVYFGRLSWFPRPALRNVWFIQRTVDQTGQLQLSVAPFSGAFWEPIDKIYLNPRQIIFWTRLRKGSSLAQALENQSILPRLPASQGGFPSNINTRSTTNVPPPSNTPEEVQSSPQISPDNLPAQQE